MDYFSARSDHDAAKVIDGGPDQVPGILDTVPLNGIDPVVMLGELEELLTDVSFDDVSEDPRAGLTLAEHDGGQKLVIAVTDALQTALTNADAATLDAVAGPWSQIEEFYGELPEEGARSILAELSALASRATQRGERIYCWIGM